MEIVQEWPVIFDNNYKSQIMEEAEVEAILLGTQIKEKEQIPLEIPVVEILEEAEEAENPQIPIQQEQLPQIPIQIGSVIS